LPTLRHRCDIKTYIDRLQKENKIIDGNHLRFVNTNKKN